MQSLNKQAKKKPCSASMSSPYKQMHIPLWRLHRNFTGRMDGLSYPELPHGEYIPGECCIHICGDTVFLLALAFAGIYSNTSPTSAQMLEKLFKACLGGIAFSIILMFLTQVSGQVSRLYVGLFAIIVYALLVIEKYITAVYSQNARTSDSRSGSRRRKNSRCSD